MARDLPLSNGYLLVDFDLAYNLRDVYYDHAGQPNHAAGRVSRFGVWTAYAGLSWLGGDWLLERRYQSQALVTDVRATHLEQYLRLEINDAVPAGLDALVRRVTLHNLAPEAREVRVFWHLDLDVAAEPFAGTALYHPETRSLLIYKGEVWFLLGGQPPAGPMGLTQFSTGHRGTDADATDGRLERVPASTGAVDAVGGIDCHLAGQGSAVLCFWLVAARGLDEAVATHWHIVDRGPGELIDETVESHRRWLGRGRPDHQRLPERQARLYDTSLLVVMSGLDRDGGIIASPDSMVQRSIYDTYQYVWPRDGALVARALDLAGHPAESHRFFHFVSERLAGSEPWLWHKYNLDGSRGSTWLAMYNPALGLSPLPTEEDETALVVWALAEHARSCPAADDCVAPLYAGWARRAADWLATYRRADGLPRPSVNLWEATYGIWSYTASTVAGALSGAASLASRFGSKGEEERYLDAAQAVRKALTSVLYDQDLGRFITGIRIDGTDEYPVRAVDASLTGLWAFGAFPADDPRVVRTMQAVERDLWVPTPIGGVARYPGDDYHQRDPSLPGTPWIINTLWLARWYMALGETGRAGRLLDWVVEHALPSGVLPEQVDPHTGEPVSVAPLIWSHSAYILAVHDYVAALQARVTLETGAAP